MPEDVALTGPAPNVLPPVTLHVCVTCRAAETAADAPADDLRPGRRLYEGLVSRAEGISVVPVECLGVCRRPASVALSAPGHWTYVLGDAAPDDPDGLLGAARLYAAAPQGIVPWRDRPALLKKGIVARIPPISQPE
ncbi:DUF1636 family protein [Oryzibacter oryziterrae]|uniref:DUF1636 family protein n=1 Tax=Oryzibacter oryziterrae TaxID=2766474 RepID=UPI001F36BA7B|nr:DUF1636 domain-containing protein [Oryzibacter oryziterrae]